MDDKQIENICIRRQATSSYQRILEYDNYLKNGRLKVNEKIIFDYKDTEVRFTQKQIEILKLIAKGFSNIKMAKILGMKEAAVKLFVYRLMKYLETTVYEKIDRYNLIIFAQELDFDQSQDHN